MILIVFLYVEMTHVIGEYITSPLKNSDVTTTALELLTQHVKSGDAGRFISLDTKIWNPFLQNQDGFVRKLSTLPFYDTLDNATTVHQMMEWESYEKWHAINEEERMNIVLQFYEEFGYDTNVTRFPDDDGLFPVGATVNSLSSITGSFYQSIEMIHQKVKQGDMARFLDLDERMWSEYLQRQDGFQSKYSLIPHYDNIQNATSCYQIINWASHSKWKAIDQQQLALISAAFTKEMGYSTMVESLPNDDGLRMIQGSDYPDHRRPVLNGYDVVMYHLQWDAAHLKNKTDVMGSPRWQYALHTSIGTYIFWFSSPETLDLFRQDPWKYTPAYGGHCSHHIATDEGLTKENLDDGLGYGVVCINTDNWVIVNGTLYLNSCGMYYDFIEQVIRCGLNSDVIALFIYSR